MICQSSVQQAWQGTHRFRGARGETIAKVLPGDFYVTRPPEWITTLLGSCVTACIRDPQLLVGGMNHFMLPNSGGEGGWNQQGRYGAFAMELLINELMKAGASRDRLEIKVFGGSNIGSTRVRIGEQNVRFVREYLEKERLPVSVWDVGGRAARKLIYEVETGRVKVKKIPVASTRQILEPEEAYEQRLSHEPLSGSIELFDAGER